MKNSTTGYLFKAYIIQFYLAAFYQGTHRLKWHWQIWVFVSGHASHKHQETTEYKKIINFFAASKIQEENLGLKAETERTEEGKWNTEQISTG